LAGGVGARNRERLSVRVLVAALVLQLVLGGALVLVAVNGFPTFGGSPGRASGGAFDGARAYADVRRIVAFGHRPAGSAASRRLALWLRARLPDGRLEPIGGGLANVVGRLPGRRPAILVGAHYDLKDVPNFDGANDGGAGAAVVLELAHVLRATRRGRDAPELRFVLFDGEESPRGTPDTAEAFARAGLRGSTAYARRHAGELRSATVVDLVGQRGARWPRERNSDPVLWHRLRAAAKRAGVDDRFPDVDAPPVLDDHIPFRRDGVPAIDLIDFRFACLHRACDDLAGIAEDSLDASGEALVELLR
jgi:glutaminyl-peptide cyclotransferase